MGSWRREPTVTLGFRAVERSFRLSTLTFWMCASFVMLSSMVRSFASRIWQVCRRMDSWVSVDGSESCMVTRVDFGDDAMVWRFSSMKRGMMRLAWIKLAWMSAGMRPSMMVSESRRTGCDVRSSCLKRT